LRRDLVIAFAKTAAHIAAVPLIAIVVLSTARSFSFGLLLLLGLIVLLVVASASVILVSALAIAIWRRQWRELAPWPAALLLVCLLLIPAWMMGDYIHLAVGYPVYVGEFLRGDQKPFSTLWSSEGLVPAGCDRYLLYDPFGQDNTKEGRDSYDDWISKRRLIGGFYIRERCW
jgi:hypothetical protein